MSGSGATLRGLAGGRLASARVLRQVPFATMLSLNATARAAQDEVKAHYSKVLKAPRRYTINSVKTRRASKQSLVAGLRVNTDGSGQIAQATYLRALEFGGARRAKRSEVALRAFGVIGPNEYLAPSRGGPLADNGAKVGGLYRRIVARMSTSRVRFNKRGTKRLKSSDRGTFYRSDDLIFERMSGGKRRAVLVVLRRAPTYRPILRWSAKVDQVAAREMPREFAAAMRRAMSTAR